MTGLSKREQQVADLLAAGLSTVQVALRLGVTLDTVRTHIKRAAVKLPGDGPAIVRVAVQGRRNGGHVKE